MNEIHVTNQYMFYMFQKFKTQMLILNAWVKFNRPDGGVHHFLNFNATLSMYNVRCKVCINILHNFLFRATILRK